MKKTVCILFMAFTAVPLLAQERWTMDRCMQYAVNHSNDVRRQQLESAQRRYDERAARLSLLPTVGAQVAAQYSWGRNIDPETNTYNTITTFNNYYSVGADLPLFDGGRTWNAFRQARLARARSLSALQQAADDKAIAVMACFVEAVYNQQTIALAERKLAQSQALLLKTRRQFELGQKSRPDVAQIESQVADDDYNLLRQHNQAQLSLLALKAAMNYPVTDTLLLDTAVAVRHASPVHAETLYDGFGATAPQVQTARFNVEEARLNYRIQRAALLPTLTLGGGVSTNYYRNLSQGSGRTDGFGRQFNNNMGEFVSLSLSIPIFDPSRWRAARQAKTAWLEARLTLDDARRKLHDDIVQAVLQRDGAARELVKMERKVAADSLAWHLSVRQYEEGMRTAFDLRTAAQTWLESSISLLQMRLTLEMKERLVNYYQGNRPWILK